MLHLSASLPSHQHHQIRTNQCFRSATCNNINIYLHLLLNYTPTIQLFIREFVLLVYLVEECTTTQSNCSSSFHQHLRYNVRNHEAPFILNLSWFEKSLPIVCGPLLSCCLSICLSRNQPFRYLDSSSQFRLCWARGSLPSQIRQLVGQD